jgi:hypothetical protein
MLAIDWLINGEDRLFHLALAALMAALTALARLALALAAVRNRPGVLVHTRPKDTP